jgi:hypothetical protein
MFKVTIFIEEAPVETSETASEQASSGYAATAVPTSEANVSDVENSRVNLLKMRVDRNGSSLDDPRVWVRNYGNAKVYHSSPNCGRVPSNNHKKMRLSKAASCGLRPCSFCGSASSSSGKANALWTEAA